MKYEVQDKIPLEIYIHIPFCIRKCLYCDFLSGPASASEQQVYMQALISQIQTWMPPVPGGPSEQEAEDRYQVQTIFFGGGTPSILPGPQIQKILAAVRQRFSVASDAEISLEANPGTVDMEKLSAWQEAGVNRLSFGLQSAKDEELKLLGRIHSYEQFLESWELSHRAGFRNRNIDLMSALPGQTLESWEHTLTAVAALEPEHLSAYSLIIEEGTPFYERFAGPECAGFALLPDEDTERAMYHQTKALLKEAGYSRYEISNYARPGFECRHNCGYWDGTWYLGFGTGASSYIEGKEGPMRLKNLSSLSQYIRRAGNGESVTEEETLLTPKDQMEEFMFLGLRMQRGISFQEFERRFHQPFQAVYGQITQTLTAQGLVRPTAGGICLTDFGMDVSNYVFEQYLL